jgi:hypothetical protein
VAAVLPRGRRPGGGEGGDGGAREAPVLSAADERRLDEDLARYEV